MPDPVDLPDIAQLIGPLLQRLPPAQQPLLVALAERLAAERYRGWAARSTPDRRAGLLACAEREEEIARRVEALYPDAAALQREIVERNPDLLDINRTLFAPFELRGVTFPDRVGFVPSGFVAVPSEGRITPETPTIDDWAPPGGLVLLQLGHAGARGACKPRSLGVDLPLDDVRVKVFERQAGNTQRGHGFAQLAVAVFLCAGIQRYGQVRSTFKDAANQVGQHILRPKLDKD